MSGHKTATLEDTVYFWFGANDTSGSGGDGASMVSHVREAGVAAATAPLVSPTPTLLSHASFPAGCYEIAVDASSANGFSVGDTFAVFASLLIDSQNPTGFVGSCTLTPLATQDSVDTLNGVCSEARLAELDAANIPASLDTLNGVCSEARLVELDAANIPADIDTLKAGVDLTATMASSLVDDVWDEVLSGATHNVATSSGRRLRQIQDFGIYDMASVWVDEVAGQSTGTVDGEDATVTNRANDFDNAQTVAASVNLDMIHIQSGNTITLSATLNGFKVWGNLYNVALGGQNIGGTMFDNCLSVTGIGTGTTPEFANCILGQVTLPPCRVIDCQLAATFTAGSSGAFRFIDCESGVAGAAAPVVHLNSTNNNTLEARDWSGGFHLKGLAASDVVTLDGVFGTITLEGADAAVEIRGVYKSLTNSLTGSPTVNIEGAILGGDVASLVSVCTEARLAELDAANIPADIDALPTFSEIFTTTLTEAYAADGAAPTLAQFMFLGQQRHSDFTIAGTSMTVFKLDGTTTAAGFTLADSSLPTGITRSS